MTEIKLQQSTITFPAVDFSDGLAIGARTHLLLVLLERAGRHERAPLLREAKKWLKTVGKKIADTPADTLLHAISDLDLLHRIIYGIPAPAELTGTQCLRAFNERIHGNTRISDTDLYNAITERLNLGDRRFIDKSLRWRSLKLDRWYRESCNGYLHERPLSETLPKIDILLSENLYAFTGAAQEQYKHTLAHQYLPLANPLPGDDAPTLLAKLTLLRHHRPSPHRETAADSADSFSQPGIAGLTGQFSRSGRNSLNSLTGLTGLNSLSGQSSERSATGPDNITSIIHQLTVSPSLPADARLAFLLQA